MSKILIAYVPVLDKRYRQFFENHRDAKKIWILGEGLIAEFDHLRKDIRRLNPELVALSIGSWPGLPEIGVADVKTLKALSASDVVIIMPDEEECHDLARRYLNGTRVEFENIFLRWDRRRVLEEVEVEPDQTVNFEGMVAMMMPIALAEAKKATNFWRQIGAVLARDGKLILAGHNRQVPSTQTPYHEGDPRLFFKRGENIELTTDEHAEAYLIATAARLGIVVADSDCFVTTFPCPPCAKLVATARISRLFFLEGYARLDGQRVLREAGVEIIRVKKI